VRATSLLDRFHRRAVANAAAPRTAVAWHSLPIEEVRSRLGCGPAGLDTAEAARRLALHGPNVLPREPPPSPWWIAARQLSSPLMLVLLVAAAASLAIGDVQDAVLIAIVVAIDAGLGGWQQLKAERSSRALDRLLETRATVSRDGTVCDLPADRIVPGDLVWLESGDRVPADARIVTAHGLEVDESLLTGESLPVTKDAGWRGDPAAPLADRLDMVFAGTIVTHGRGTGVVTATAADTAIGEVAVIPTAAGMPPLVARMEHFTRSIALAVLVAAATVGLLGVTVGHQRVSDMLLFAVALAVSVIPEGLPVSLTVALSIATARMATRGVIVRRLEAVEGLGSCTMIASDKTGTLTCNELTVTAVELPEAATRPGTTDGAVPHRIAVAGQGFAPDGGVPDGGGPEDRARLRELATCAVLCNEATLHRRDGVWTWRGDSVDVALLTLGAKLGLEREPLLAEFPQFDAVPFEPEHRFAATFHDSAAGRFACIKGAPEAVLPLCDDARHALAARQSQATAMAAEGLRVLALARGRVDTTSTAPRHHHLLPAIRDVTFLGFVGLLDPLRPAAADAVRRCRAAGVRVVMITGDHRLTSLAIARQLGLAETEADVITGDELARLSPAGFAAAVRDAVVFARVTPRQKLDIVTAARAAGHFVAVTGDGANDAPALRAANIGVAMGRGGTDVARDAAGIVISDDNFATLVAGIEEGRIAYDNVRKVILLLVSTGAAELVLVTLSVATGTPLPLTAAQILWLNLVTNGIQDVALAFEPGQGDELRRPPRPPREPIFDHVMAARVAVSAVTMGVAAYVVFRLWLGDAAGEEATRSTSAVAAARNATLLAMVLLENVHLGNCRSETRSAFSSPPWRSPFLLVGTLVAVAVHLIAMHLPFTQRVLGVSPLPVDEWLFLAGIAATILPAVELHKWWCRRTTREELPMPREPA
jgi:magnesium-transporting ATPase (P-type)